MSFKSGQLSKGNAWEKLDMFTDDPVKDKHGTCSAPACTVW